MSASSLLFIAPADLGEAVLATGAVDLCLHAAVRTTVVCSLEAAPLFRALPGLLAIHRAPAEMSAADHARMMQILLGRRFSIMIDGRGGMLGLLVRAERRVRPQAAPILRHRVEDWSEWMGADHPLAPKLWLDEIARTAAEAAAPGGRAILALAPGGASAGKRWPAERYAAAARRLVGGPLAGGRVLLFGAAERDADLTAQIAASLDADGVEAIDLGAKPDLLAAAALMERATLCIGNDNVLTHIAASMGAPTLSLFGPTDERVRAPYGARAWTLRGREYEAIVGLPALAEGSQLEDISVDAVEAAALDLLNAGGLR